MTLIHWDQGESVVKAHALEKAGYLVSRPVVKGTLDPQALHRAPPTVFIIDLSRAPAQGLAVATALRQRKDTRFVPLLFVEEESSRATRARKLLPDATYTTWRSIEKALERSLASPREDPIVPGTMDVYAGRPLAAKFGIREKQVVALLGAPEGFQEVLGTLPDGVRLRWDARGHAQVVLLFVSARSQLEQRFPSALRALDQGGRLWIIWPKKASGAASELRQQEVRAFGLERALVDYKVCAVNETWSGLCFARRARART